jgi:hypothetical protein
VAMDWLVEAQRRCLRETDAYAALHVDILADRVEIGRRLGDAVLTDALAREWVAAAARAHMDAHVARAAAFLAAPWPEKSSGEGFTRSRANTPAPRS